jgi:hypothetical protein
VLVGAAPSWFADNLLLIAAAVLGVVTVLLVRMVKDATTRVIFVAVVVGLAVFLYANRVQLESCARTCECRVVRQDVTVPFCDPDLALSAPVSTAPRRA